MYITPQMGYSQLSIWFALVTLLETIRPAHVRYLGGPSMHWGKVIISSCANQRLYLKLGKHKPQPYSLYVSILLD